MPSFCTNSFKDQLLQRFVSRFTSCHTSLLHRVMNAVARFMAGLGSRDHANNALRELHWLPIDEHVNYILCVMTHPVVRGTAPEYVSDMVTPVSALGGRAHLRSAALGLHDVPSTRTLMHGRQSLSVAGPKAWNSLVSINSRYSFNCHLQSPNKLICLKSPLISSRSLSFHFPCFHCMLSCCEEPLMADLYCKRCHINYEII
jgi:hypothetical protein